MRRPRHLSAEERALWDRVAANTKPMQPNIAPAPPARDDMQKTPNTGKAKPSSKASFKPNVPLPDPPRPQTAALQMDHKSFGKLKRGKLVPEARIDLHGMTMSQAHAELTDFILRSRMMGRRLVLVITGKGKTRDETSPIPAHRGLLRYQVPQWLALPPLAQAILQVTPAHNRHGGDGACYVYLRKFR